MSKLKDEIARCGGCKNSMPYKLLDGKLIHLSNHQVKLGRCAAGDLLLSHIIAVDEADNPMWDGEALNAICQLEVHGRTNHRPSKFQR